MLLGFILLMSFVLISAFSDFFIGTYFKEINTFELLFFGVTSSWLYFFIREFSKLRTKISEFKKKRIKENMEQLTPIIIINITTLTAWYTIIESIKLIQPAIAIAITCASTPIISLFLNKIFRPGHEICLKQKISSFFIFIVLIYLVGITLLGLTSNKIVFDATSILGISLALIGGTCNLMTQYFAKKLVEQKFSAGEIITIRHTALLLVICLSVVKTDIFNNLGLEIIPILALLGLLVHSVPSLLASLAIIHVEPIIFSFFFTFIPVLTFAFEFTSGDYILSIHSLVGVIFLAIGSLYGLYSDKSRI